MTLDLSIRRRPELRIDLSQQEFEPTTAAHVAVNMLTCFLSIIVIEFGDSGPNRIRARLPRFKIVHVEIH
jgi:hypothetical protein